MMTPAEEGCKPNDELCERIPTFKCKERWLIHDG
jgi:hypothetical protein